MDKDKAIAALNKLDALLRTFHTIDQHDLQFQIAVLSQEIRAEVKKSPWIKVSERLPEADEPVLVYNSRGKIDSARHSVNWYATRLTGITHWMPLPEPPEESKPCR